MKALLPLTLPLSWLYGAGVLLRHRRYERGRADAPRLPTRIVSVGSLTVGGSGKTPIAAAVARELLGRGHPVAVLSRGYGRRSRAPFVLVSDGKEISASCEDSGDEPQELARSVPGLAVAVGPDRWACGRELLERLGPHLLVLDDGFQHRRLPRDLDLVCFDAGEPVRSLRLLPAGRLREPLGGLSRADAILWTRWSEGGLGCELERRVAESVRPELPRIRASTRVTGFARVDGPPAPVPPDGFRDEPVGALLGVARPERILPSLPARVVFRATRRDHHWWTGSEISALAEKARSQGARALLTTGKDAARMKALFSSGLRPALPVFSIRIETEILDRDRFRELFDGLLAS